MYKVMQVLIMLAMPVVFYYLQSVDIWLAIVELVMSLISLSYLEVANKQLIGKRVAKHQQVDSLIDKLTK